MVAVRPLLPLALAALLPACGGPIVAPLRYEPLASLPEEPFRATPPDATPVPPSAPLPFQVTALPSGLRVAVLPRPGLPILSLHLVSQRGSADVAAPIDGYGVLQRVMESGSEARRAGELSLAWARIGAAHRVFFWDDACGLSARAGSADLDTAISLLAEVATRPRLVPGVVADARTTWLHDFAGGAFNVRNVLNRNVATTLFGKRHPYGFDRPTREHATGIDTPELAALHAQLFHPSHVTLVVVGDVTPEDVLASAARWLGGWTGNEPPRQASPRLDARVPAARLVFVERRETRQVDAAVVALAPEAAAADLPALEILARALGGASSRLRGEVRGESGAAYNFGAGVYVRRRASILTVSGALDRDKAGPAIRSMLAALAEARTAGVPEADFERARTSLLAQWRTRIATSDGLALLAAITLANGQPLDAIASYPARLQAVTRDDLRRAAQRWLGDESVHVVVAGEAGLLPALTELGLGPAERRTPWGAPVGP